MDKCFTCRSTGTHRVYVELDLNASKRGMAIADRISCGRHVDRAAHEFKQRFSGIFGFPGLYVRVLVEQLESQAPPSRPGDEFRLTLQRETCIADGG